MHLIFSSPCVITYVCHVRQARFKVSWIGTEKLYILCLVVERHSAEAPEGDVVYLLCDISVDYDGPVI